MLRHVALLAFVATPLAAQEVAISAGTARPGPWNGHTDGPVASAAVHTRYSRIDADSSALPFDPEIGLRASVSRLGDRRLSYPGSCSASTCLSVAPLTQATRLDIYQLVAVIVPLQSPVTRLEFGVGAARHVFSGARSGSKTGWMAHVTVAGRLTQRAPLWLSVGYDWFADPRFVQAPGWDVETPDKLIRLGLAMRR